MKKIVILLIVVIPGMTFSQIKPSIPKAETALKAGKIDEAKSIIDATVGNQEFMVDKKGQPSKNAAKAYYVKGVIYASIDTSKKAQFNALDLNAFATAKESFDKSKELDGGKSAFFMTDMKGLPILNENANVGLAQAYFSKGIAEYSDKKNYKRAFELTEQTLYFIPNDTTVILNAGLFFGPSAEEYDKSIVYLMDYIKRGGGSSDAYVMLFSIYRDQKKDNEKALALLTEAMAKFPKNTEFPKHELNLYIKMNRMPEAKATLEKQAAANPSDKEIIYLLALINMEMGNKDEAKKWYTEAIKLDPKYFDAKLGLAEIIFLDAKSIKVEMNHLGITAEDKKKRFELDKSYVEKLKIALPYWQDCEKLSPDDPKVLDVLLGIYTDLDMQPEITKLSKHMKTLGLLD